MCVCVAVVPGRFRVPQARWGGGEGGEKKGGVEKRKGGGETKKGSRRRRTAVHDKKKVAIASGHILHACIKGTGEQNVEGGATMLLRVDCHWVTRINNKRCFGQRSRSRPMCYRLVLLRCLR